MATIAELLMEKGRVAREARMARTAAWMPLVDQLANLPNQIRADRAAQAQAQQKAYDAQQERAIRQQQLAQGQQRIDQGQVEIDAKQRDAAKQQAIAEVLGEPGVIRDDGTLDQKLLVDTVTSRGRRDLLPDLVAIRDRWDEAAAKRLKAQADAADAERQRSTAANQQGVRRMAGEYIASNPNLSPEQAQQVRGMAFQEGVTIPNEVLPSEPKLTFGAPQPYMVGGRRTLLRPRSDGALVNLQGAVVQEAQPDVAPSTAAPSYLWAVRPGETEAVRMTEDEARRTGATQPRSGQSGSEPAAVQLRNDRAAAALNSLDRLEKLAPQRAEGPAGIAQGFFEVIKGYLGYNTDTRQFQALKQPTAMQMAAAVQGAANLSDSERKAMAEMLGSIGTMDVTSQMALLKSAKDLISGGADVVKVGDRWVPASRAIKVAPGGGGSQQTQTMQAAPQEFDFDPKTGQLIPRR